MPLARERGYAVCVIGIADRCADPVPMPPRNSARSLISRSLSVANSPSLNALAEILRSPAALLLAAGYCAGIVLALQRPWGRRVFGIFAPVGRMALTNYLAQGLLYAFVMFGVGPGLGLAGRIGSAAVLAICIAFFAFQTAFSHWWLARYRFGPMEWVWRTLTYGERPPMRRARTEPATV